uniref:Uncharacterized protein MANES_04G070000 n=1 Tax=Rhizophora mucronata TaxID=61149 RepID=A0A2P2PI81_RHIMU
MLSPIFSHPFPPIIPTCPLLLSLCTHRSVNRRGLSGTQSWWRNLLLSSTNEANTTTRPILSLNPFQSCGLQSETCFSSTATWLSLTPNTMRLEVLMILSLV